MEVGQNIFTQGQQLALVVADSYRAAKRGAQAVQVKVAGANEGPHVFRWRSSYKAIKHYKANKHWKMYILRYKYIYILAIPSTSSTYLR